PAEGGWRSADPGELLQPELEGSVHPPQGGARRTDPAGRVGARRRRTGSPHEGTLLRSGSAGRDVGVPAPGLTRTGISWRVSRGSASVPRWHRCLSTV